MTDDTPTPGPRLTHCYQRIEAHMVRETHEDGYNTRRIFNGAAAVVEFFSDLQNADREKFCVLHLDQKHKLVAVDVVAIGSLTMTVVHPREVYKMALLSNAAALIFVHNHPSGDPTPSREDIEITRRLREVGDVMGIRVLDHIIIGHDRHCSFVDDGYW